jgi:hypothetical protein
VFRERGVFDRTSTGIVQRHGPDRGCKRQGRLKEFREGGLGYAHRQPHPRDRRSLLVDLTPSGRREVGTLFELLASDVNAAVNGMSSVEQDAIAQFLTVITGCFEQRVAPPPMDRVQRADIDGTG